MSKAIQALRILLPLLLTSCIIRERPSDLRLERVYVADISSSYRGPAAKDMPRLLGLTIELSTTETFPLGVRIAWGFCGDKKRPYFLYRATDPNAEAALGPSIRDESGQHQYLAVLPIVFHPVQPLPELPDYDIANDGRDICLNTGSGTYADVWRSNEVRVPRSLIEKALHEPAHTHLPLSTNQLP